jgi:hypothetical protein
MPDGNSLLSGYINTIYTPFLSYGTDAIINNGVKFSGNDGLIIQNTNYTAGYRVNLNIGSNTNNYNVRSAFVAVSGANTTAPVIVYVTISSGVYVGSTSTGSYSLDTGVFPTGSSVVIYNNGYIYGAGGAGGDADVAGSAGGPAMRAQVTTTVINNGSASIGGGGGGGGGGLTFAGSKNTLGGGGGGGGRGVNSGAGGAGGSGSPSGDSGSAGSYSNIGFGGAGGGGSATAGGNGGGLGSAGGDSISSGSTYRQGGAGGAALIGRSFVNRGVGILNNVYGGQS